MTTRSSRGQEPSRHFLNRRDVLRGVAATGAALGAFGLPRTLAARQATPTDTAEWILGLSTDTNVIDPNLTIFPSQTAFMVQYHIFDTLTAQIALLSGPGFELVPRLAESWTLLDEETWELKLLQGVKWHNGDELTVDDVIYSYDVALSPDSWRTARNQIAGVEAVDPATVRITTKGPQAGLFIDLSTTPIMPRRVREEAGPEAFDSAPIGSGPYRFVRWDRGEQVVLEVNPDYWKGPVDGPGRLVFRSIPDASTRVAELSTGGVQIIDAPGAGQLAAVEANGDLKLVPLKGAREIQFLLNTTKPPFDDLRVRQAINYAVDRQAILRDVLSGFGELLHGPFASAWLGYDPDLQPYPYDPQRATQLLAEAGYTQGFETVLNFGSSSTVFKGQDLAEIVAAQLAAVGVRLELIPTDDAKIAEEIDAGTAEGITQTTWGASADPNIMLNVTFANAKILAPDQQLNDMIAGSKAELDPAKRGQILRELGRYIQDQALWLFLHAQDDFWVKQAGVSWQPYPVGGTFSRLLFYRPTV